MVHPQPLFNLFSSLLKALIFKNVKESAQFQLRSLEYKAAMLTTGTTTRSYEENFGINLLYVKILALLLVKKSHVTTLLPSDWFKILE